MLVMFLEGDLETLEDLTLFQACAVQKSLSKYGYKYKIKGQICEMRSRVM